jgi:hypothetical protein
VLEVSGRGSADREVGRVDQDGGERRIHR